MFDYKTVLINIIFVSIFMFFYFFNFITLYVSSVIFKKQIELIVDNLFNDFKNLIVSKGSISLDGVSLTISDLQVEDKQPWLEVSLVPVTLSKTTLNALQVGNKVNIEFDQVGKYIAQNLRMQNER